MNKLELPNTRAWLAGQAPTADMMNSIQDAFEFLNEPPECHVVRASSTVQTIPSATWTRVIFDTALADSCARVGAPMWNSSDPTKLSIQISGWYEIEISVPWVEYGGTDNKRRLHLITQNVNTGVGPTAANSMIRPEMPDYVHLDHMFKAEVPLFLNKGDYIHLWVYNEHTSSVPMGTFPSLPAGSGEMYSRRAGLHMKWVSL